MRSDNPLALAKRAAKSIHSDLVDLHIEASLPRCQNVVAAVLCFAHWHELTVNVGSAGLSRDELLSAFEARGRQVLIAAFPDLDAFHLAAEAIVPRASGAPRPNDQGGDGMIRAEGHSDDFSATTRFDAAPWFEVADGDEIVATIHDQLSGSSYRQIKVTDYLLGLDGYDGLQEFVEQWSKVARKRLPGDYSNATSYRLHLPDVVTWLRGNRPDIAVAVEMALSARGYTLEVVAPEWDIDPRWNKPYDRRLGDAPSNLGWSPIGLKSEARLDFDRFLLAERKNGVERLAVVPRGDKWLIAREWSGSTSTQIVPTKPIGGFELMHSNEMLDSAVPTTWRAAECRFQEDGLKDMRSWRSPVVVEQADGGFIVDFSRLHSAPQTLEILGFRKLDDIDAALEKTRGLWILGFRYGEGEDEVASAFVQRWHRKLPSVPMQMFGVETQAPDGPYLIHGYSPGQLRGAMELAATKPVVLVTKRWKHRRNVADGVRTGERVERPAQCSYRSTTGCLRGARVRVAMDPSTQATDDCRGALHNHFA